MNITQLIYFIEVVISNFNVSVAAQKLHVSQSTLSKAILNFEETQDVKLFIRHGKRLVDLTPIGRVFYRDARRVIRDYKHMLIHVQNKKNEGGKIKIGIVPAVLVAYFSTILPRFQLKFPKIKIKVHVIGGEELQQELLLEKIDLAYLVAPIKYESLNKNALVSGHGTLVFNPKLINISSNITISQIANLPLVLLDSTFTFREQLDDLFEYKGKVPNIIMDSNSENFLLNVCRSEPLVSILPSSILKGYDLHDLDTFDIKQLSWELVSSVLINQNNPLVVKVRQYFDNEIIKMQ
ncbi:LysR family transcriptional regulator [Bombilactobacillus bombi]|uniref:LysR family transcriptional regulator n=1 Tax=Bombilactobacillus bombi TaxID=1303590 RepID=UPI0015E5A102|nr:LysR family transcriptional regulator [Bombilactobacillus bombi]MBA1434067.1 LysR family transcriptional regulator [Bombilactobacillus bombi]